jgi:SAM-dependent methyltransferase
MSVATHLRILVTEYDARIRTFVPNYERMIDTVAETLRFIDETSPTILDLGVGTGALASRCLDVCPHAHLIGLDIDPEMLELARTRLLHHDRVDLRVGDFLREELPPCDVMVACISLHHVPIPDVKRNFYAACHHALKPGGLLVSADCYPHRDARVAADQHQQWLAHIEQSYSRAEAEKYLACWADEDVYFPLADELAWLQGAGFATEVIWRVGGFAVVAARR